MRRSNFPDLTSSSEMRRSNEFKSCFTIRRAEGSDKLQIPSNRQRDEKVNISSDLASSSGMRRSTKFRSCFIVRDEKVKPNSGLASSSGMRRSNKFRSCFIVRDEKIKTNSDLASSSEMKRSNKFGSCLGAEGQILLQIQSIRQWNGGSNSTSDPIYPSVEWWIKLLFQIMPLRQG
ncbi:hypothetical protein GQ457_10G020230 [Hibiscus cannabinus]